VALGSRKRPRVASDSPTTGGLGRLQVCPYRRGREPSLKLSTEGINDPRDKIGQLLEAWDNRLTLSASECVKRYIEGKVVIGIRVRTRCSGQPVGDYLIQLSRARVPHYVHDVSTPDLEFAGNDNQELMFVDNIQIVSDKQAMVLNVANGVIRLQSFNAFCSGGADALYLSARSRWIFAGLPEYRKFQVIGGLFGAMGDNELPDKMVERRPELMNDFSDNDTKSFREWAARNTPVPNMAAFARIVLHGSSEGVICSVKVRRDLSVEIADMLIGPFNLLPDAI
jgi:hypothetical protein